MTSRVAAERPQIEHRAGNDLCWKQYFDGTLKVRLGQLDSELSLMKKMCILERVCSNI